MKALQCFAKRGELSLEDVAKPSINKPDDVLIKVGFAGLCGTDLHIMSVGVKIARLTCFYRNTSNCRENLLLSETRK